jgi:alpha-L-fucosidase 2
LPALPSAWPSGSVNGLRARGGFTVDLAWRDGKLTAATIHNVSGTTCAVRYGDKTTRLTLQPGTTRQLDGDLKPAG